MGTNLFLKPDEANFLSMAVISTLEDIQEASQNQKINWNPEARKYHREMIAAGTSLSIKLKKLGFNMNPLPPFEEGDEEEFLTKES